jgi:hypothetical protein
MDQLAPARTECLQYLNQHRDSCLVRVCAVEPGLRGQTQRRNFEIQKYMATQLGMRETEARRSTA